MIRLLPLAALGLAACGAATGPSPLYPSYFLARVDGQFLPVPYGDDGTMLRAGQLAFPAGGRPRGEGDQPIQGLVRYTLITQRPGEPEQHSSIDLEYAVQQGILTINLCPPLALCIVSTELVGPLGAPTDDLVLTHYLAGNPGTVYRYAPSLPD
jgi:hypothetical protein